MSSGLTNGGYAYNTGEAGMKIFGVRKDTPTALESDGKFIPPTMGSSGQVYVGALAQAVGGATPYKYIATAATNQDAQSVKASAGTLYFIGVSSVNAAVRYLKLYDKASAPSSSDTPVLTIAIPGATTGGGNNYPLPACGLAFANGIAFRLTTGVADNDANAVTTQEHVVNLGYK